MNYHVAHVTEYLYSQPVSMCHNLAHLTPRNFRHQTLLDTELTIDPAPEVLSRHVDYYGNETTFFTIHEPHERLIVRTESLVDVRARDIPPTGQPPSWEAVRDEVRRHATSATLDALQYIFDSPFIKVGSELAAYAAASFLPGRAWIDSVTHLSQRIHHEFRYDQTATTVATPISEVLRAREGVCQDFAQVMIGCLRAMELPARYVSGYLRTQPATGQPELVGAEASHAWVSSYCPGYGWIDFDPTNDNLPTEDHVTLGWGRDFDDVSPIKGVILGGGEHTIVVSVEVTPATRRSLFAAE